MFLLCIYFLMVHVLFTSSTITLKKCCELGYSISSDFECEPNENGNATVNELSWFPMNVLMNSTTLLSFTKKQEISIRQRLKGFDVEYGFPNCSGWSAAGLSAVTPAQQSFHVVLGEFEEESGVYIKEEGHSFSGLPPVQHGFNDSWLIPFSDVCFESFSTNIFLISFCPSGETPWISKCCPARQIYNTSVDKCQPIHQYDDILDWRLHSSFKIGRHYVNSHTNNVPDCKIHTVLRTAEKAWKCRGFELAETTILPDGSLRIKNTTLDSSEYCGEKTWHEGNIILNNFVLCGIMPSKGSKTVTYGVLFIVGGFCLLITVGISFWLPELRRNLYNYIALTHNSTLMIAYFSWGVSKFITLDTTQCTILCLLIQFTFLGSLFWMNAMCIEISSTFRKTRVVSQGSMRRYIKYSAYAWGFTVIISITTVTMEFIEKPPFNLPRPGFSCFCDFARDTISIFFYFYGPMAILLTFNLILYVFTAWKIMTILRQTSILHHTDSNTTGGSGFQSEKQRLVLYTKLFLLMGITWMTEIIGWAVNGKGWFWMALDVINLLRAVLIFVLFICKPPVLRSIKKRLMIVAPNRFRRSTSCTTDAMSISTTAASRKASQETRDLELKDWKERKISNHTALLDRTDELSVE